jgi:hypothetical protein
MPTKTFTSGRIKKADYNTASRQLDLHWDNKTVLAYKQAWPRWMSVCVRVARSGACSGHRSTTGWGSRCALPWPSPGGGAQYIRLTM